MQNVKPFLIRFARSPVQELEKPEKASYVSGTTPDPPPPPPDTMYTRVRPETTDEN